MLNNFEKSVQIASLEACLDCIKNNAEFDTQDLYHAVHERLSNASKTFMQHGFEYRGINLQKDPETQETIIEVITFDAVNEIETKIPIGTGIILEPKPSDQKPKRENRREKIETMLA